MTKKKPVTRKRLSSFTGLKWTLNNLTEDDLERADAMDFDLERFGEWLDILIDQQGMEFKFAFDAYSKCPQMTLIGAWEGYPNSNYAISARSSDGFADCARLLVFKFDVIAQGDLAAVFVEPTNRRMRG